MTYEIESYIETVSGKEFNFLEPNPEAIIIEDIAFSLSNQCRFTGHTKFYSVAEHSVAVASRFANTEDKQLILAALLHDASEAYLGDITSPVKQYCSDYKNLERTVQEAIYKKFNLDYNKYTEQIKVMDIAQLYNEAHYLLKSGGKSWKMFAGLELSPDPLYKPMCWTQQQAFHAFMSVFTYATEAEKSRIIV